MKVSEETFGIFRVEKCFVLKMVRAGYSETLVPMYRSQKLVSHMVRVFEIKVLGRIFGPEKKRT
jgi:hypothetical protein